MTEFKETFKLKTRLKYKTKPHCSVANCPTELLMPVSPQNSEELPVLARFAVLASQVDNSLKVRSLFQRPSAHMEQLLLLPEACFAPARLQKQGGQGGHSGA